ncbi:MAG: DUF6498-containing protein [Planctomycetota bacterium]
MSYHLTLPPRSESAFTVSVLGLILANLLPVCGVVFFEWRLFDVLAVYWVESGIIAFYTLLRMAICTNMSGPKGTVMAGSLHETKRGEILASTVAKIFMMPFFCFHFGMFMFVHGIFLVALTREGNPGLAFESPLAFLANLLDPPDSDGFRFAVIGLTISHGLSFFLNYLRKGEYRTATLQRLMMAPYGRVMVMHITLIAGAFLSLALGEPFYLLLILVLLKTIADARSHLREHGSSAAPATVSD